MSVIRRAAGTLLPVGSRQRQIAVRGARSVGLVSGKSNSDYQRWIDTVEPSTFSPYDALLVESADSYSVMSTTPQFAVRLNAGKTCSAGDLNRTAISLQSQSFKNWTATFPATAAHLAGPKVAAALKQLLLAEPRFGQSDQNLETLQSTVFVVELAIGDVLSPACFHECALAIMSAPSTNLITAAHDWLNAAGDQRNTPRRHFGLDPDSLSQFDILAGFVAVAAQVKAQEAPADREPVDAIVGNADLHVHLPQILLHRRFVGGPPQRILPPTPDSAFQSLKTASGAVVTHRDNLLGTYLRHDLPSGSVKMCVMSSDALPGVAGSRQHADLAQQVAQANRSCQPSFSIEFAELDPLRSLTVAAILQMVLECEANVAFIVDGSLRLTSPQIFRDLSAIALRPDVAAVAPLVSAPSGIVIDAGLERGVATSARLSSRCGHLLAPPHQLLWNRSVASLSGRVIAISRHHVEMLASIDPESRLSPSLLSQLSTAGRLVLWAQHQATYAYGHVDDSDAKPARMWSAPRLQSWFDEHERTPIPGYRPINDSKAEGLW